MELVQERKQSMLIISSGGINGGVDAAYDFKLFFNQIRGFDFTSTAVDI